MGVLDTQLKAIKVRNFRIFFLSQLISQSGSWMQAMVESWLVFRLTQSAYWLGVVAFVFGLTSFVCTPLAGVMGDRFHRKTLLLWVEVICLVQALILAALVATSTVQIWHILILTVILGAGFGFELTLRISLISDLVEEEYMPSAIRLTSFGNYLGRIIGPAAGGLLLEFTGEATCFVLNGLSFFAVIAGLLMIREKSTVAKSSGKSLFGDIGEGFKYVTQTVSLYSAFMIAAMVMLAGYTYSVLFPLIATDVLGGGTRQFSILVTCFGIGGTIGSLMIPITNDARARNMNLILRLVSVGGLLVLIAYSPNLILSSILSLIFGWVFLGTNPTVLGLIQTASEKSIRSRVNSLYFMLMLGTAPIGGFLSGLIAGKIGVQMTTVVLAAVCTVWALVCYFKLVRTSVQ